MEDVKVTHFSDLSFKDKAAYVTAIASFILGWILLFVGLFLPPTGEITPSVLTAFGTALVFTGSIFGIAIHARNSFGEAYSELEKRIDARLNSKEAEA